MFEFIFDDRKKASKVESTLYSETVLRCRFRNGTIVPSNIFQVLGMKIRMKIGSNALKT